MTRVLLIADTERVQRIFQALEDKGALQLRAASTLGELELQSSPADFTFVQSRISGFSGEILLRHLDKVLPEGADMVLLAEDAEEAAQSKRHGRRSVDLSLDDVLLEQTIGALLTGAPLPAAATGEATLVATPPPAKVKIATPPPVVAQADQEGDALPFEEVMRRASANVEPLKLLEVEDRVEIGKGGTGAERASDAADVPAVEHGGGDEELRTLFTGESLADAMRRAERNKKSLSPYLIIVPALVLIAIPLIFYLTGQRSAPAPRKGPISKTEAAPAVPTAVKPAAAPQVQQPATPATTAPGPVVQPAAKPEPAAPARPELKADLKPAAKRGLENLPPMLEGTRLDADYGKSHPGWVRYIGLRAEYKLFKENNLFRAMQVVAVGGGTISEELFKRVLLEFGGIDSYRVESSDRKGEYLVEQCATKGNTALTIYRNKNNLRMKALVVYYR